MPNRQIDKAGGIHWNSNVEVGFRGAFIIDEEIGLLVASGFLFHNLHMNTHKMNNNAAALFQPHNERFVESMSVWGEEKNTHKDKNTVIRRYALAHIWTNGQLTKTKEIETKVKLKE